LWQTPLAYKTMNKKTLFLILLVFASAAPVVVSAQAIPLGTIVNNAKNSLTAIAASASTIAFIVAGIMFLTATGNPQRMTIARGSLIAAIAGIVIIILANFACDFVGLFFQLPAGAC